MPDKLTWVEVIQNSVASLPIVPTAILFCLLVFAFALVLRAQSRDDFDFADMLRDDDGKVSSTRMFSFICLAVTSWIIATLTISDKLTPDYFWYYLIVWSGTAVALKLVEKWNGTLPFGRVTETNTQQAPGVGSQVNVQIPPNLQPPPPGQ